MISAPAVVNHLARVLIIDDERANRELLHAMLAPEGYRITTAASGEEALAIIAEKAPDIVLLDIMMPGMDGYQVAARIKGAAATKNIPVIMITVLDDREAKLSGLGAGAEDFLTKPVDHAELCVRVRNLLRLKGLTDYCEKYNEILEGEVVARTADLVERTLSLEQKATALRESEDRTNYALGAARMGVWQLDLQTRRVTWTETMAPIFGLSPEQAPDSSEGFLALIHPDDRQRIAESLSGLTTEGIEHEDEFRVIWPDGSTHWVAGQGRRILDSANNPVRLLGIAADVNERKGLEAQFRQAQKMEAVGQLAGGLAHDFNNLLTSILGYSTLVIDTLQPADSRLADMDEIVKAAKRAAALTGQLLAFSRKQVLQPSAVDLNALVTGMQEMLSRLIGEQVNLVPILAANLHLVRADTGQLEQVLMNLVVNARDAMPSGGRLAIETANVELDEAFNRNVAIRPGSYVMLAVSDSGIGMSESTMQRVFEPFFTTKEIGKGTGLGLATVYGIVSQSSGYIWVYSEPGKGATFKVYLPRAGANEEPGKSSSRSDGVAGGTEALLLVEDDDAVRSLTRRILEDYGYQVFDSSSPRDAEQIFDEHSELFSALVTDMIMPGSSGPTLFAALSKRNPSLKVLYVSGYTGDTIVQQGELESGFHFLQKPFSADELGRRLREVLDS